MPYDRREDPAGSLIAGETGLAHTGPIVNHESFHFVTHSPSEVRCLGGDSDVSGRDNLGSGIWVFHHINYCKNIAVASWAFWNIE
jgi:hypothetical protein